MNPLCGSRIPERTTKQMSKGKPGSDFFYMVFEVVRMVPVGRVTTYGAIAAYLGVKGSSRMVGWAMNASNSHHSSVPAHRVVNREGMLTGKNHFNPPQLMQQLLEGEGIRVKNDKILNFKNFFWDPGTELKL